MSHRQTRIEQAAEGSFPFWVALVEEKCTGANYDKHRNFCKVHGLTLSKHGHSVVWQREWYCVFCFGHQEHEDTLKKECCGKRMHPSERGKGKRWATWKKGTYRPKPRNLYDFSED